MSVDVMKSIVQLTAWLTLWLAGPAFGATTVEYLHTDALGSVVAVSNSAGAVIERREYEPYGRQLAPAAPEDGPAYTGHVSDAATGLSYMQQRYYDPAIGRFLSVDPVTADTVSGWNFNRYNYAANNPYKFTDPDGRCIWDGCIAEIIVGSAIISMVVDAVAQKIQSPDQPINKTQVAISGAVGAATAVIPGAAAARVATIPAKIAVAGGTAATIGSAGNAAQQKIQTGHVDGRQAAVAGVANAAGLGIGNTVGAAAGRAMATETTPAIPGVVVKSLRGREFTFGGQPATKTVNEAVQHTVQDGVGETGGKASEAALERSRRENQ